MHVPKHSALAKPTDSQIFRVFRQISKLHTSILLKHQKIAGTFRSMAPQEVHGVTVNALIPVLHKVSSAVE